MSNKPHADAGGLAGDPCKGMADHVPLNCSHHDSVTGLPYRYICTRTYRYSGTRLLSSAKCAHFSLSLMVVEDYGDKAEVGLPCAQVLGFPLQSKAAEGAGGDALADELPVLVPSSAVAYFDQVVLLSILANTLLMTFMHYEDSVNM